MERESDNSNNNDLLLNRIFIGLNQPREPNDGPSQLPEALLHLRQENDALRKTLRMQNGLRQRFEQLYDSTPIGYLTITGNGCIVEANLMVASLFGIQRSWLIGQSLDQHISDTDHKLFNRHLEYIRNTRGPDVCTIRIINHNGDFIPVRMESTPRLDEAPSAYPTIYTSIIPIETDSEQKPLLEKKSEDGDSITKLTDKNEHLEKEIKRHEDTEAALLQYQDQLDKFIKQQSKELENLKDQLASEISVRKQAEEKARLNQENLTSASRLNSVVEMASGLAHEINQPLSAITTYTQSCLRKLQSNENPERVQTLLEQILVQTQRTSHIIQHLRDFITKKEPHRESTDINKIVQYALKMLRNDLTRSEIKFNVEQVKPVPHIMANPVQIEQVMLNFIQNAMDALKKVPPPKRELDIKLSRTQTHICITIHDTGPGITQQNADKITKPFFTTKTNGMGLGLAISHALIEDHGGQLIHKKSITKGATFLITLAINGQGKPD